MSALEIFLPAIVLLLSFLMKLFVDRTATIPLAIETTYDLPIDIVFLGLTFCAAFAITNPDHIGPGLVHFSIYICIAVVSIVLSRRSNKLFDESQIGASVIAFLLNFTIAAIALVESIELVSGRS